MRKLCSAIALIGVFVLTLAVVKGHLRRIYSSGWLLSNGSNAPEGTVDFLAYWSAFQALKLNLNPYDPASLRDVADHIGFSADQTQPYWNPPWMLALMAPVLSLPFNLSATLWMYLSIIFTCVCSLFVWKSQNAGLQSLSPCLVAGLCFYPLWETLYWGQIGALVALGVAGFVWSTKSRHDFLAGSFLILASLKPHLLYLFFVAVVCWVLLEHRYRVLLGAVAAGTALGVLIWVSAPDIFQHWLRNSARSWEHIATRRSATLVGFSRGLIFDFTGRAPVWPLVAIPGATALGWFAWLLLFRKRIEWSRDLPLILCCSVFTAPYGWAHDHLVLSVIQITAIGLAFGLDIPGSTRMMICLYWLAFQLLVLGLSFSFMPAFQFFWFPLGIYLLWVRTSNRLCDQAA